MMEWTETGERHELNKSINGTEFKEVSFHLIIKYPLADMKEVTNTNFKNILQIIRELRLRLSPYKEKGVIADSWYDIRLWFIATNGEFPLPLATESGIYPRIHEKPTYIVEEVSYTHRINILKPVWLEARGQSSFINAAIQCLRLNPSYANCFITIYSKSAGEGLLKLLGDLFETMYEHSWLFSDCKEDKKPTVKLESFCKELNKHLAWYEEGKQANPFVFLEELIKKTLEWEKKVIKNTIFEEAFCMTIRTQSVCTQYHSIFVKKVNNPALIMLPVYSENVIKLTVFLVSQLITEYPFNIETFIVEKSSNIGYVKKKLSKIIYCSFVLATMHSQSNNYKNAFIGKILEEKEVVESLLKGDDELVLYALQVRERPLAESEELRRSSVNSSGSVSGSTDDSVESKGQNAENIFSRSETEAEESKKSAEEIKGSVDDSTKCMVRLQITKDAADGKKKEMVTFERLMNFSLQNTLIDIHRHTFYCVKYFFTSYKDKDPVYDSLFEDVTEDNWKNVLRPAKEAPCNIPYTLQIHSTVDHSKDPKEPCKFCNRTTCKDCFLPYTSKTLHSFLIKSKVELSEKSIFNFFKLKVHIRKQHISPLKDINVPNITPFNTALVEYISHEMYGNYSNSELSHKCSKCSSPANLHKALVRCPLNLIIKFKKPLAETSMAFPEEVGIRNWENKETRYRLHAVIRQDKLSKRYVPYVRHGERLLELDEVREKEKVNKKWTYADLKDLHKNALILFYRAS
eukprot:TRINITY_DN199_c0_g1_i13.p1 TRINITY_DN199_c0_g1~~TRINITY_DN199_c0_g1_i13.p1  ORF type:complete len:848 (+),score=138.56 TRINITY_DN199_c0_g1_i13:310-2544(+)